MNNVLYQTSHDEGRIVNGVYEYNITDHLGNLRVAFKDSLGIAVPTQSIFYDSWGLSMKGMQITRNPLNFNKHQFLNRETQFETGFIDLQNRQYDPQRGQMTSIDALAELNRRFSPFVYGNNNGLRFIDPDGMMAQRVKGSDGNSHDVSEDAGVDVYNASAEDDKDKGKKISTGRGGGDNNTPFSPPEHLQASSLQNASISQGRMDNFSKEDDAAQLGVNIYSAVESGYGLTKAVALLKSGFNGLKALFSFSKGITNVIPEGKLANHIFSGGSGKFVDNVVSRTLISELTNSSENLLGVSQYGTSWYAKTLENGTQIYGYTQNGIVKGAGINQTVIDLIKIKGLK